MFPCKSGASGRNERKKVMPTSHKNSSDVTTVQLLLQSLSTEHTTRPKEPVSAPGFSLKKDPMPLLEAAQWCQSEFSCINDLGDSK